jgi:hypothetical protein
MLRAKDLGVANVDAKSARTRDIDSVQRDSLYRGIVLARNYIIGPATRVRRSTLIYQLS